MNQKRIRKPGAGRPPLDQADRKEKVVRVRLTEDDLTTLARLQGLSNHRSLSDLIRTILYKNPVVIQIEETGLAQLSSALCWLNEDLQALIKSKKATAEAVKEKAIEMQQHLSRIEDCLNRAKYHQSLMNRLAKE